MKRISLTFALISLSGLCFFVFSMRAEADKRTNSHDMHSPKLKNMEYKKDYGSGHADPVSHILDIAEELGLNQDQISKIKAARLNYKKKNITLTANIKIARLDLRNLIHSGSFNEAKILVKSDELGKFTAQKIRLGTETTLKVMKTLTSDQIKKARELHLKPGHESIDKKGSRSSRGRMIEGS